MIESYRSLPGDLRVYRIVYASYLIVAVIPVAPWFQLAPDAFFMPALGPAALFTQPYPVAVMHGLNVALAVCAVLLLAGRFVPFASLGVGVTLLLLNSGMYSFGKIDHDFLVVLVPLLLAWSWGDSDEPRAMPLALLAVLLGFAMSRAGLEKAMSGWLDPSLRCTYGSIVSGAFFTGRETPLNRLLLPIDSALLWKSLDYATVAFECALLPAAFRRRWFVNVLAIATLFHLGVSLMMRIDFACNIIGYAAFVRWSQVPYIRDMRINRMAVAAAGLAALIALLTDYAPLLLSRLPLHTAIVWIGAAVGMYHISKSLMRRPLRPS